MKKNQNSTIRAAAEVLRLAGRYRAVAFDVFDTLLRRDVAAPSDLFRLQGPDFLAKRTEAEASARAGAPGEVTLKQIYAQPALAGFDPDAECSLELRAVRADTALLHAARLCHERSLRVYAVSDMYLPKEQIEAMLRRCGFDFLDGIFVSSEYGVQKRSGKLFEVFLKTAQLRAKDVLFVGDSWRADVLGAALQGIRTRHWPVSAPRGGSWQSGALDAFLQNRRQEGTLTRYSFGYTVLGPLAVAFADWLWEQRSAAPEKTLFFLARDMELVYRVYTARHPGDRHTAYLQVSRRGLCPSLLQSGCWELLCTALPRQRLTGAQLAAYCDAKCPPPDQDTVFDLKRQAPSAALLPFLKRLRPLSDALGTEYLRAMPVRAGDFLADIGSGGTTQRIAEALLGVTLHGLYLACDERLYKTLPSQRAQVYLFDATPAPAVYWAGQPILERLISQECGTVTGYRQTAEGVAPVLGAAIDGTSVREFQRGTLDFARDWQDSVLAELKFDPQTAIEPFLRVLDEPTRPETELLGSLTVEDGGCWPLAEPQPLRYYLRHPQEAGRDFSAARWKVGFLKRALPLALPYGALYRRLKGSAR